MAQCRRTMAMNLHAGADLVVIQSVSLAAALETIFVYVLMYLLQVKLEWSSQGGSDGQGM
jgi:hypothetical protein